MTYYSRAWELRQEIDRRIRAKVRYTDNVKCLHVQTLAGTERFAELPTVYTRPFRVTSGDTNLGAFEG